MDNRFKLVSDYQPRGDQPEAINTLVKNLQQGMKHQVLLGATGTGKPLPWLCDSKVQKPTLVIAHNKTLAAQLCSEFKEFFLIMRWNILLVIMIITSPRLMCRIRIPILKKMPR